jgi:hypothetical protein
MWSMSAKQRTKSAIIVQRQAFISLWYRRYSTNGTDTLVLYRRDRPKGRFGTVGLDGWLVRLCGQRTLQLVAMAWECVAGAYDPTREITLGSFRFDMDRHITHSMG